MCIRDRDEGCAVGIVSAVDIVRAAHAVDIVDGVRTLEIAIAIVIVIASAIAKLAVHYKVRVRNNKLAVHYRVHTGNDKLAVHNKVHDNNLPPTPRRPRHVSKCK